MENLIVSTRKKIVMENMFVNVKISAENNIKKVLNVIAYANVSSCESEGASVSIGGEINATILYLSENGQVESAVGKIEFLEKQKADFALKNTFAKDYVKVENINFSSNEAMISVSHHADVYGVYDYEIPKIDAGKDGLVLSASSSSIKHVVEAKNDDFVVTEDYQTNFDELNVLTSATDVTLSSVTASVDKVLVEGKLITEIVANGENGIERIAREIEFSQEIAVMGVVPTMTADARVSVKNTNLNIEKTGDKCVLAYNIEVGAVVYVYDETTYEFADDMFSLESEIKTTYGYLTTRTFDESKNMSGTFATVVDISNIENLDDVVGVFNAGVLPLKNQENNLSRAVQKIYVLYKTESGFDVLTQNVEFDVELGENLNKYHELLIASQVVSFKVKAGREIEVVSKYDATAHFETEMSRQFIGGYEIVGAKPENEYGIKVYVTKEGQSLFDVSKILNVKPETISEQNEIDDVFESGQKIYVYYPVNLA